MTTIRHKFGPGDTKCEPCAVNGVDSETYAIVSGEPWCEACHDERAGVCETCNELIDGEDLDHGEDGEYVCWSCAHTE